MDTELEGIWNGFRLTEEEMETVETRCEQNMENLENGKTWLVGKLLTQRPFNKDAMLGTLKVVLRISKEAVVTILDSNLFLFKFHTMKDKLRVLEGSPWSFNNNLVAFQDYNGDLRGSDYHFDKAHFWIRIYGLPLKMLTYPCASSISKKLGELLKTDVGSGDFLRLRVNMDITKPLRRFIIVSGTGGQPDIKVRLAYERLPTFCYECGLIGHSDIECKKPNTETDGESSRKQYGEWLRVSPLQRRPQRWSNGGITVKHFEVESRITTRNTMPIEPAEVHGGATLQMGIVTASPTNYAIIETGRKKGDSCIIVGKNKEVAVSGEKIQEIIGDAHLWDGKGDRVDKKVGGRYQYGESSNNRNVSLDKEIENNGKGLETVQNIIDKCANKGIHPNFNGSRKGKESTVDV